MPENHNFLQECYYCKQKVGFQQLSTFRSDEDLDTDMHDYSVKIFAKCSKCNNLSLYQQNIDSYVFSNYDEGGNEFYDSHEIEEFVRIYPKYIGFDKFQVGLEIYLSFKEATDLYENGFFNPAMTSLRRTLENICLEKGIPKRLSLEDKLLKLLEQNIIDQKLYDWGEALRKAGNLTAHSNEQVKKEDLQDMFDFIELMIDYIFVLSKKFEDYKKRHSTTPRASL